MTSFAHTPILWMRHPWTGGWLRRSHSEDITPGEIAAGVIIGRASEYFDFFVFGIACVLAFPYVYFPFLSPLEGMLAAFSVFALAFIARPVGTFIGMEMQRRWSMAAKLTIALFLLGSATVGIALLPSYDSIGVQAIWWLMGLRIAQGLAVGGSWEGLPSLPGAARAHGKTRLVGHDWSTRCSDWFYRRRRVFGFIYSQLSHEEVHQLGLALPVLRGFCHQRCGLVCPPAVGGR